MLTFFFFLISRNFHLFTQFLNFYCTLGSGVHVQIMQGCCIGAYITRWFAASISPLTISGISPHVIRPHPCCPSLSPHQMPPVCDAPLPESTCSHCSTPAYEWVHVVIGFLFLRQFAENDGFQIHPSPYKGLELIVFYGCVVFHGVYVPHFLCPVYHWWAFGLVPCLCYCKQCTLAF